MENGPTITPPFESLTSGPDKKDDNKDKKKAPSELFSPLKKKQAEQNIARSLDKFSLFEKADEPKTKAEKLAGKFTATRDGLKAPEATSEAEAPTQELSKPEETRVNQEIARDHLTDLQTNDAYVESGIEAIEAFLADVSDGEAVEASFEKAATEVLNASPEEVAELLAVVPEGAVDDREDPTSEINPDDTIDTSRANEGEIFIGQAETSDETAPPAAAGGGGANQAGGNGRNTGGGSGRGNGAGNNTPPSNNPPAPGPNAAVPPYRPAWQNPNVYQYNSLGTPEHPMLPGASHYYYERRAQHNGLLVGGLVGYLIGRRRGRIKTEKRLLPVQKRLEKRVTSLERTISDRELLLQRLAAQKGGLRRNNQQLQPKPERLRSSKTELPSQRGVPLVERTQPGLRETRLGMEKPSRAEHLGHMAMNAEAPNERIRYERPNNIRQAFRPEEVKTMRRSELLELSEKIVVEGASLRHIYESHLIGEQQLRHLVSEYLRGKDIRRKLRREMIEREIDFERDPILRDRVRSNLASSSTTLNQLLENAGALPVSDPEDVRQAKAQAERSQAKVKRDKNHRQAADAAMVTAIVVLALVVMALLLRR